MSRSKIIAIDPGNEKSGYVVAEHDGQEIVAILEAGKTDNRYIYDVLLTNMGSYDLAVEMVASYGMAVGKTVFDTCVFIGRVLEFARHRTGEKFYSDCRLIYRKDEKLNICGTMKAKDANIRQALIDRYAAGVSNSGKGTKKEPGFFYGFKADIWQAFAVAVTYFDLYVKGEK